MKEPCYVNIENEASFLAAIRTRMNLFAGAGFSIAAASATGPIPVGATLADELRDRFNLDSARVLDLPKLCTIIGSSRSHELNPYLKSRFTVTDFDARYKAIGSLAFSSIFTTNIDNLFYAIYKGNNRKFVNDVYQRGTFSATREAVDLVQLHGSVTDDTRPYTFGTLDLAIASTVDPDRWNFLRQRLMEAPTLYWGYALSDAGTLQSLRSASGPHSAVGEAWIQVRPGTDTGVLDYYRALNLQIIEADTTDLLKYLEEKAREHILTAPPASQNLENVPSGSDYVSRPIEDFFRGAAPQWSDIANKALVQLAPYRRIADNIQSSKNTIITGIPSCGKSTLLMQIALCMPFAGPKIIHSGLSEPQAQLLRRQIGSGKALVILDNVASDIYAFKALVGVPNICIIAADRDYNISTIGHLIDGGEVDIMGVSEASEGDLSKVWQSIPPRMRKRFQKRPPTSEGVAPTVSELVRHNITGGSLDDRIVEYVKSILLRDSDQANMIILACYLHRCGSPLSMDVAIAFFRNRIDDFDALYRMMGDVGDLLLEHDEIFFDDDQDYFFARSHSLAENVLQGVPGSVLREVLVTFHSQVSHLRISSYDTFKRKGYDSRLFERAFPKWREGAELYDQIYEKTSNSFVLQQRALFSSARGEYQEAFRDIEMARGEYRRGPNWSIENSYNVILFNANFSIVKESPDALVICLRALSGLEACFRQDKRKGRHALSYAGLALKLSKEHFDETTIPQLKAAYEMLSEAKVREEWFTGIRYAQKDVRRRINELL